MEENKKEISLNVFSSFIFLTNAVLAYYYNYTIYLIIFLFLFTTSVNYHYYESIITNILDKICILLVVSYGFYIFVNKCCNKTFVIKDYICAIGVIVTFILTIYLYCYGYLCNDYCFCQDIISQEYYHAFLHFMASLGHHIIIIM
jgi:uncharacterized membrane protein